MPVLNYDQLIAAINLHSAAEPSLQSSLVNLVLNYQKTGAIKPGKTFSKQLLDDSEKVFQSLCTVVERGNKPTTLSKIGAEIGLSNRNAEERKRLDKALRYIANELKTAHKVGFVGGKIKDPSEVNSFQVRWIPTEFSLIDGKISTGKLSRNNEGSWTLSGEEDATVDEVLEEQTIEDQPPAVEELEAPQEVEVIDDVQEAQEIDLTPIEVETQEELVSEECDDEVSEETPEIDIYASLDPEVKDLLLQDFTPDEGHELLEEEEESEDDYYVDADESDIAALFDDPEALDEDEYSDED